jgi:putative oxidoreductase
LAGILSFIAAALHLACIFVGPDGYLLMGAGAEMASMAAKGKTYPTVITIFISSVITVWGLYAWSGAGILPKLPLLRTCLILITSVYLLRGIGGFILPFVSQHPQVVMRSFGFWMTSSAICLLIGFVYLKGILASWGRLNKARPS